MELTGNRDPALFKTLRKQALTSVIEMSRWKSDGHAIPAFWLLGRISGLSEDIQAAAWSRASREAVINTPR